MYISDKEKTP